MFFNKRSFADFTGRFFEKGESKVQIDPQFVHTFTLLDGRFSDRLLENIDSNRKTIYQDFRFCHSIGHLYGADAQSFLGMHFIVVDFKIVFEISDSVKFLTGENIFSMENFFYIQENE